MSAIWLFSRKGVDPNEGEHLLLLLEGEEMKDEKTIWQSKVFWANILTLAVGVVTIVAGSELVNPEIVVVITGTIIPVLNVALRFVTDKPIAPLGPKK